MPYVLYSSREPEQDWSSSVQRIDPSTYESLIYLKVNKKEDDVEALLAELKPRERAQKCPWVPPCGAAFGTVSSRMTEKNVG
ncbi:hypothetical protein Aperf_G00000117263 [Anoplocephala perfoliata]